MPPYTTRSAGRSATSGSRLFWIIRYAASAAQVLHVRVLPRGARTVGAVGVVVGAMVVVMPFLRFLSRQHRQDAKTAKEENSNCFFLAPLASWPSWRADSLTGILTRAPAQCRRGDDATTFRKRSCPERRIPHDRRRRARRARSIGARIDRTGRDRARAPRARADRADRARVSRLAG